MLLACLMACQEHTAMLTHSPTDRHAWIARPGPSWPAHRSNPLSPPVRQADRCRLGTPEAQERQRGRGRGGQDPAPASYAP